MILRHSQQGQSADNKLYFCRATEAEPIKKEEQKTSEYNDSKQTFRKV